MVQEAFLSLFRRELTRRTLFKGAAAMTGAAAIASSGLGSGFGLGYAFAQAAPFKTDLDVLNFARRRGRLDEMRSLVAECMSEYDLDGWAEGTCWH